MRRFPIAACAAALVAIAANAPAQEPPPTSRAEQLFQSAKELMSVERHAEACPMLEESHRLDPAGGTLLTLALCHEAIGRTATAYDEFRTAADLAHRDGRVDRETIAQDRAKALEPRLCYLAIRVHEITLQMPGIQIAQNGVPLNAHAWEGNVDPGSYTVRATAPGRTPFVQTVDLFVDGSRAEIIVPELAFLPRPVPPPPPQPFVRPAPEPVVPRGPRPITIAGIATGGAGLIALGIGTYFGIRALDQQAQANEICPNEQCSDQSAVDLNDNARASADWSTGLLIAGGLATAAGIVLVVMGETGATDRTASAWARGAVHW